MMNEESPLITIVTPSYNYSQYIRECLDSVRAQDGVLFEHLIFDAGSTDGTLDIIREYDYVKLVVEPDKGMSDAINKGFRAARGKWVMWLNTDDRLKSDALLKFKEYSEKHPDADVIYGAWDFIDGSGKYMRTMQVFPFKKLMLAHYGCYIGSTSAFYRRSTTIDEGFLLNENFRVVMDGEYYNRLSQAGKCFKNFNSVLADFRIHGQNISKRNVNKTDMDGELKKQIQYAESVAIRRIYGIKLFQSEYLNNIIDCLLYYLFKVWKLPLKLMNQPEK